MSDVVMSVRDLTKTYQVGDIEVRALRGASLDLKVDTSQCSHFDLTHDVSLDEVFDRNHDWRHRLNGLDRHRQIRRPGRQSHRDLGHPGAGADCLCRLQRSAAPRPSARP